MVASRSDQIKEAAAAAAALDIAAARAGHARWLGERGSKPEFCSSSSLTDRGEGREEIPRSQEKGESPLHVPEALHPVLLEPSLPPLPEPPSVSPLGPR